MEINKFITDKLLVNSTVYSSLSTFRKRLTDLCVKRVYYYDNMEVYAYSDFGSMNVYISTDNIHFPDMQTEYYYLVELEDDSIIEVTCNHGIYMYRCVSGKYICKNHFLKEELKEILDEKQYMELKSIICINERLS